MASTPSEDGAPTVNTHPASDTELAEVEEGEISGDPGESDLSHNSNTEHKVPASSSKFDDTRHNESSLQQRNEAEESYSEDGTTSEALPPSESNPPLPSEEPPLPVEELPTTSEADDGWAPIWEETSNAFYFYNRFTGATQWHNPRVPEAPLPPGVDSPVSTQAPPPTGRRASGYDPAIHGDYDESAWYAQPLPTEQPPLPTDPAAKYAASAHFNRFTGRYQAADIMPENFNDENKSKRQMNAFFDVDAAANSHDGRSLKEERSGKKLSKQELKQFKEKRKAKKEEKRRAWLRD
jgi:hypothetical protein